MLLTSDLCLVHNLLIWLAGMALACAARMKLAAVPEPGFVALLGLGLAGLAARRGRSAQAEAPTMTGQRDR